uniref:Translocase of outer mitochondrial membrane 20 n=1 Tax=Paramormyrops kingsleyae TaxID=1676925 RepID=A0A3B3SAV2_9TELE
MMGSKTSAIAAGVCGALFVGYCIYFDRKRRSDPNFKNRLRERRRKQRAAREKAGLSRLPDLKDAEAVQKFFLEEIQLGEELLAQGDYEKGVDHLTNAIAVCGQPQQLLQVLQQTLPPPVFQMLLTKLPTISQVGRQHRAGVWRLTLRSEVGSRLGIGLPGLDMVREVVLKSEILRRAFFKTPLQSAVAAGTSKNAKANLEISQLRAVPLWFLVTYFLG